MTYFERYRNEIIEAGEFLKNNPDWQPDAFLNRCIETFDSPAKAIGFIVQGLTED